MPHLSILLLRHNGTGITHFPLRPVPLIAAVLLASALFLSLGGMLIWQSVQLHEQQQWNAQRQSQQIHIHERMEIAASQAERVEVLGNRVRELRDQLATLETHSQKKSATQQNLLYHIRQIHSLACQQGSYQCRAVLLDTKALEADPLNWLNMISKDFHHLTLSQRADLTVPVSSELVQEEIWDLKQSLNAAEQELAEYAVLMQAREQEVRQLAEKIQEITGIRLLAEVPATPVDNEGGKGGPFLEESLLPVEERQLSAEPLDPRVILEQELSSYHSTHNSLQRLYEQIRGDEILWRSTPTIAPVKDASVSSHYGRRRDPFTNLPAFHSGIDFSGPAGTPIYAPADGIVRKAGPATGYGLLVELEHGRGISTKNFKPTDYVTRYGHLSRLAVQTNRFIQRGELLGYTGNTGRSTGSHLHYEIHVNKRPINPWRNLSHFSFSR
ncbi:MAG: hypothetical protein CMN54_04490 [SAR324 cluster bacterium]|uniref:M23ase beta-sheet core domain-containing protein n=1 Tax=SAR324 cluster bacterium TaxID=2024889 RepID=A0A2D6YHS1_9DELT|nr:hypothetical protein [SAR324 cluster bacterium]